MSQKNKDFVTLIVDEQEMYNFNAELLPIADQDGYIDISKYVPPTVPDIAAVCVGSYKEYTQYKRLNTAEMEPYHHAHSLCVALLNEKRRVLKDLAKEFAQISYVDISPVYEGEIHTQYIAMLQHLWENRNHTPPKGSYDDIDYLSQLAELPAINKDMMQAIASRHICSAGIGFLTDVEKYYEGVFENKSVSVTHFNCYRIYLPDVDVCAIYNAEGNFIELTYASSDDRGSLNSVCFAGYRRP